MLFRSDRLPDAARRSGDETDFALEIALHAVTLALNKNVWFFDDAGQRLQEARRRRSINDTKALEVLQADVAAWKARPQPKLKLSTDRP